ncbi:hypothetical protein DM860_017773 [Cuscuta australis]|uniref:Uncharacterized protein n=1 Tax=Cuscuta australis TaxID=267555 RepID=A0A328D8B2_9ASTE|nr:hypothetical protein DM860_017773 [Cuscuta australis]
MSTLFLHKSIIENGLWDVAAHGRNTVRTIGLARKKGTFSLHLFISSTCEVQNYLYFLIWSKNILMQQNLLQYIPPMHIAMLTFGTCDDVQPLLQLENIDRFLIFPFICVLLFFR